MSKDNEIIWYLIYDSQEDKDNNNPSEEIGVTNNIVTNCSPLFDGQLPGCTLEEVKEMVASWDGIIEESNPQTSNNQQVKRHNCSIPVSAITGYHGIAADTCWENENGEFYITNDEYDNQVNYCPFCGAKAPTQIQSNDTQQDSPENPG